MSGRFARDTDVSVEKSRAEIERILLRYGASRFAYYSDEHGAKIAFSAKGRRSMPTLRRGAFHPSHGQRRRAQGR